MGFFKTFIHGLRCSPLSWEILRQKNEVQSTNTHPNKGIFLRITTMHASVFLNRCKEWRSLQAPSLHLSNPGRKGQRTTRSWIEKRTRPPKRTYPSTLANSKLIRLFSTFSKIISSKSKNILKDNSEYLGIFHFLKWSKLIIRQTCVEMAMVLR
jgi:hypothetical protein